MSRYMEKIQAAKIAINEAQNAWCDLAALPPGTNVDEAGPAPLAEAYALLCQAENATNQKNEDGQYRKIEALSSEDAKALLNEIVSALDTDQWGHDSLVAIVEAIENHTGWMPPRQ